MPWVGGREERTAELVKIGISSIEGYIPYQAFKVIDGAHILLVARPLQCYILIVDPKDYVIRLSSICFVALAPEFIDDL